MADDNESNNSQSTNNSADTQQNQNQTSNRVVDVLISIRESIERLLNNNTTGQQTNTSQASDSTNQQPVSSAAMTGLTSVVSGISGAMSQLTPILRGATASLASLRSLPSSIMSGLGQNFGGFAIASIDKYLAKPLIKVNNILKDQILSNIDKFITKTLELTESLYDASVDLQKTLGISRKDSMFSIESYKDIRYIGASISDLSNAHKDLFQNVSNFSMLTESSQKILKEQATILEKNGFSLDSYSAGIQIATKSMNMTAEEASKMNSRIVALGMDIGVTAEKMGSDLKSSSNIMAKLGSNGEQAFRRLAVAAKVTGMEVSRIVSITEKFDTFQGAAEQAGKLNAALGGNFVNAMDLMSATDPVERFEMIKDSILNAGLTFDTMSYYQKNFYKEALGLNDVGELALMLSGNMKNLGGDIGKTSADFKKMADRAQKLQTLKDFFTNLFYNSIIPVLDKIIPKIQDFVDSLAGTDTTEKINNFVKTLAKVVSMITILTGLLTTALGIILLFVPGTQAIGLGLIGVGASTTFVGLLGDSFSNLIGSMDEVNNRITDIFNAVEEVSKAFMEPILDVDRMYGSAGDSTQMLIETIKASKPIFEFLGLTIASLKELLMLGQDIVDFWDSLGSGSTTMQAVKTSAEDSLRPANLLLSQTSNGTVQLASSVHGLGQSVNDLTEPINNATQRFQGFYETMLSTSEMASNLYNDLENLGSVSFLNSPEYPDQNQIAQQVQTANSSRAQAQKDALKHLIVETNNANMTAMTEAVAKVNFNLNTRVVLNERELASAVNKISDETMQRAIRNGSGVA